MGERWHVLPLVSFLSCVALFSGSTLARAGGKTSAFSTSAATWDGYTEFARLAQRKLGTRRVLLTKRLDYSALSPSDAVLIVHPERALDDGSLSAFLADGGRVALLDDFGQGESLLRKFGIRRGPAPADPAMMLRSNPDLAIAVPATQTVSGRQQARHPITAQTDQVVTNHAQTFEHPDLTPVLQILSKTGASADLAVTGVIAGRGRLFALGDPSVFINLMMRYPGNRHLAEGLVSYLSGPLGPDSAQTGGDRSGEISSRLYVVTNEFEQVGRYGEEESLLAQLRSKWKAARERLLRLRDNGLPAELATGLAAALAIWIFLNQLRSQLRVPRLASLTFSFAPNIVGQTGWVARASLLGHPKTNPLLPLMELDSALREAMVRNLKVQPSLSASELEAELLTAGLTSTETRDLTETLSQFRRYGQSLSQGKPLTPTENELEALHQTAMRLIAIVEGKRGNA